MKLAPSLVTWLMTLVLLAPGCAAFASLDEPRRPFNGVRFHAAAMIGRAETHCAEWRTPQGVGYWLFAPFTLPALACCLTLDLAMLPTFMIPQHDAPEPVPVHRPGRVHVIVPWRPTEKEPPPTRSPDGDDRPCKACGYPLWSDWNDCPRCGTAQLPEWPPAGPR